jgi:protein transport protein SEC13
LHNTPFIVFDYHQFLGISKNILIWCSHEGPVWQVTWAHPKFGNLIASSSYDRKVFVWKETANNAWTKIYEYDKHESSGIIHVIISYLLSKVNSISWAPHEFGLSLACASSDCSISVLTYKGDNSWDVQRIPNAHAIGVNAVSWAPAVSAGSLVSSSAPTAPPVKRLVSGGCDNLVKIWR